MVHLFLSCHVAACEGPKNFKFEPGLICESPLVFLPWGPSSIRGGYEYEYVEHIVPSKNLGETQKVLALINIRL